jgi:hypothetical protein
MKRREDNDATIFIYLHICHFYRFVIREERTWQMEKKENRIQLYTYLLKDRSL